MLHSVLEKIYFCDICLLEMETSKSFLYRLLADIPIAIQKVLCICSSFSHCERATTSSRKSFVFFGLAKIVPTFKQPEWNHAGSINFLLTCAREKIRILSSYILYYACILNREGTIRSEEGERARPGPLPQLFPDKG